MTVAAVLSEIEATCERIGRDPKTVTVVIAGKGRSVPAILEVANALAWQPNLLPPLGENYLQEHQSRREELGYKGELHFIGPIQSNKIRNIANLFDVVQSVGSMRYLGLLIKEVRRLDRSLRVYLQVNISSDDGKQGFDLDEIREAIAIVRNENLLVLDGLMTITRFYDDVESVRPDYHALSRLRDELVADGSVPAGAIKLSMGMSRDFLIAIEEGADLVRLGTVLFS